MFFWSSVEDTPAVELAMLELCDHFEVFASVVESIVVDMVHFHSCWCVGDKSVHPDRLSLAGDDLPGDDVFGARRFESEPFEFAQPRMRRCVNYTKAAIPDA